MALISWQEEPEPMPTAAQTPAKSPETKPVEKLAEKPAEEKPSPAPSVNRAGNNLAAPSRTASPSLPKARTDRKTDTDQGRVEVKKPKVKPPTFDIVRIAKDRTAVIAGRAPAGSTVRLSLGGKILAEAPTSQRGEWVAVIEQPLPSGQAELDLVAIMPDGRSFASESVVALMVPSPIKPKPPASAPSVASRAPKADKPEKTEEAGAKQQTAVAVLLPKKGDAPAQLLQKPEPKDGSSGNKLSVDTVEYDDKGNVVVSGSAPKGAKVRTYVDNKPVGIAKADQDKAWRLKPKVEVAPGSHTLRVDQVDEGGRVVRRIELPFVRVAAAEVLATTTARYRVIVQPGNSLWRIARRVYGSGNRYTVIYQANDGQIRNPDMIFPGQVFNLPAVN
ncbi:MAG: LysM peptidoglycan-binding domain-containing protein [Alphaproteobacteria bacterium]|nr:LysM peptidoglycan-binding domain-containing protein [Alphaproteobacteria bacterium]